MIKVSIVTISFNQVNYLERAIQSVLNQDYPNIEYIVVDPGSTDGSRELIKQYESSFARLILEPDNGPADGLNRGFAVSTGQTLSFLNSDDILYPDAVSAAVRFLSRHPEVDIVSGHAKIIDSDDRVLRLTYSDRMSVRQFVYRSAVLIQPSTFFRRRAFALTLGFNPKNRVTWDGELFFDMAMAGCRFGRADDIWSGFRLHKESLTTSRIQDIEDMRRQVNEGLFRRAIGRPTNHLDRGVGMICRVWKHLVNPRDTIQRVFKGPVSHRVLD